MKDRHFLSALCYENFASLYYIPYIHLGNISQMDVNIFCNLAIKSNAITLNSKS